VVSGRARRRNSRLRLVAFAVDEGAESGQGPGVDDVVGVEPAALGGADAVAQVVEVDGGVCVGVDGELHAVPFGPQDQLVRQVEAVREAVDLQRGAGTGGGGEHRVVVGVDRL